MKKKLTAKEVIEQIESAQSVEEVQVLAEDDTRKTVSDAAEKRISELSTEEAAEETQEETPEETEEAAEETQEETPEETEEATEETPDKSKQQSQAETIEVDSSVFSVVSVKVSQHLEGEQKLRGVSGNPKAAEARLEKAAEILDPEPDGDTVEVPVDAWEELKAAVADQKNYDQYRRGLSTPSKESKAIMEAHELLNKK